MSPYARYPSAYAPPRNAGGYADAVLADNPVAYYRLGDAIDATGNTTATVAGAPVFGGSSLLPNGDGASMALPNTATDHIAVSGLPALGPGPWTLETWARFDTDPNYSHLIASANWGFAFVVQARGAPGGPYAQFQLQIGASDSRHLEATVNHAVLALGAAYHLVATYDGATACIYVDGELAYTGPLPAGATAETACHIGSVWAGAAAQAMQEAAIYDKALTAAQVAAHYAAAAAARAKR